MRSFDKNLVTKYGPYLAKDLPFLVDGSKHFLRAFERGVTALFNCGHQNPFALA